jgi:glycosyltransferase involved in cell wall biosynthesis
MPKMIGYDFVYIHREATPLGPPFVESYLFILGKKVIYDFDDAIFIAKTSDVNRVIGFAKWPSKVRFITKNSYKVAVCNNYLVDWVGQYNNNAVLIPTTIDLEYHKPLRKRPIEGRTPVIGWTGSRSTMKYLDLVREALVHIQKNYKFEFRVICDVDPGFEELNNYCFIKWNFDTEIADLSEIDVGLMPVPMGDWERGKVGFKAIQYSGVSAVPVVSSTGSGNEVVVHGITGLVIENTTESWVNALSSLLDDKKKIETMGVTAREYIDKCYSVRSQVLSYEALFA